MEIHDYWVQGLEEGFSILTVEEAEREAEKLVKRVRLVEGRYGAKPLLAALSVAAASPEAVEALKTLTDRHGIRLILGREMETLEA